MSKIESVRMDEKGRITLPRVIRETLEAQPGDVFYVKSQGDSILLLKGINPEKYMEVHEWQEEAIREGIKAADRGDFASDDDLRETLSKWGAPIED